MAVICMTCTERLRMIMDGVPYADRIRCQVHSLNPLAFIGKAIQQAIPVDGDADRRIAARLKDRLSTASAKKIDTDRSEHDQGDEDVQP